MRIKIKTFLIFFIGLFLISTCNADEISNNEKTNTKVVCLETTQGKIELALFEDVAPKACENFLALVRNGYYDGIIFHRIIKNFMIQCGDPTGTGMGGKSIWSKPFEDEFNKDVKFDRPYLLAMANAGPNTNGSQFFITTVKTPHLNMKHTIFGEIISGKEVIQKLQYVKTDFKDSPVEQQKIIKAYIKE